MALQQRNKLQTIQSCLEILTHHKPTNHTTTHKLILPIHGQPFKEPYLATKIYQAQLDIMSY